MDGPLTRSVLPSGADVAVVGTACTQPAERAQAGGERVDPRLTARPVFFLSSRFAPGACQDCVDLRSPARSRMPSRSGFHGRPSRRCRRCPGCTCAPRRTAIRALLRTTVTMPALVPDRAVCGGYRSSLTGAQPDRVRCSTLPNLSPGLDLPGSRRSTATPRMAGWVVVASRDAGDDATSVGTVLSFAGCPLD